MNDWAKSYEKDGEIVLSSDSDNEVNGTMAPHRLRLEVMYTTDGKDIMKILKEMCTPLKKFQ